MALSRFSLDGKVALVTGGGRGIGRAIALAFADAGAVVAISDLTLPDAKKVAEEIKAKGRKGLAVVSDISKIKDSKNLVEKTKMEFGQIDVLVNNAGDLPYYGPLIDAEEWAWDITMNVNLRGPFLLSQLIARIMREQSGGSIINVSSISGVKVDSLNIYAVSKAGLIMLTEIMAKEWGQHNIRANAIAPGMIKTRLSEFLWKKPDGSEKEPKGNPINRHGLPEDVAGAALFLASDASSYVTGETILVDGGSFVGPSPTFPT